MHPEPDAMEIVSVEITAQLAPCRKCREPLIVMNGRVQRPPDGRIVIWVRGVEAMITVHHHLCDELHDGSPVYRHAS